MRNARAPNQQVLRYRRGGGAAAAYSRLNDSPAINIRSARNLEKQKTNQKGGDDMGEINDEHADDDDEASWQDLGWDCPHGGVDGEWCGEPECAGYA